MISILRNSKSLLQKIGRFAIAAVLATLMAIAPAFPAHADTSSDAYKQFACPSNPTPIAPTFDPALVRLGITPTGWSNSDDPSIDTVPPTQYRQILSEMALAGFKGSQMSGKFPKDMEVLKSELALRDITISEPWVGTFFTIGAAADSQRIFDEQMAFMQSLDEDTIVVAELGGAVHQQPIAPLPNRPIFSNEQWDQLTAGLNDLGEQAYNAGMVLVYHPHVGTGVETPADVDRLMENTDPRYLKLLLDTGHLYYAIAEDSNKTSTEILAEIEALTTKYADRIKHVHMKNIRESVLKDSIASGVSFLDSIRAGSFTVPGDSAGVIDFNPILQTLANVNYQGWLIVEAEQDPNKANPLQYALMARCYLEKATGL
ncbi:myo-inosose-2 dehydratase [Spirulina sp. 06S082]|uniref:myo-inosose-2 dehydratase n=1 Tax=Spirulina sp. 06S082 TaxID=3110248 RepID=UPI002B20F5AC|nr:myo-inosose-2 dehydratase [Spirulina sp. 06S082]MEA5470606.1 myo-inosose-2 dehydratase [Spirulina sp. 06S082]